MGQCNALVLKFKLVQLLNYFNNWFFINIFKYVNTPFNLENFKKFEITSGMVGGEAFGRSGRGREESAEGKGLKIEK